MTTHHENRATRFYGGRSPGAGSARPATPRPEAAKRMGYGSDGNPATASGGSYDLAIAPYDRRDTRLRDDEQRKQSRAEREKTIKVASAVRMTPDDLRTVLNADLEYDKLRRSKETIEGKRSKTWHDLCVEQNGETAARALLAKATKFQQFVKQENPQLAERMVANGSAEHPEVIRVCAKYADHIPTEVTKEK